MSTAPPTDPTLSVVLRLLGEREGLLTSGPYVPPMERGQCQQVL